MWSIYGRYGRKLWPLFHFKKTPGGRSFILKIHPGDIFLKSQQYRSPPGSEIIFVVNVMASCSKCGKYFANVRQLGPHRRRCDSQSSVEDSVEGPDDSTTNDSTTSYSSEDSDRSVRSPAAIITQPVNLPPVRLRVIARRTSDWGVRKPLVLTGKTSPISKRDARD